VRNVTYLEPLPPSQHQIGKWNSDILIDYLTMSLWRIVVSKQPHRADDTDTRGVSRHNHDAMLLVFVGVVGVTFAQDEMNSSSGVTGARNPPVQFRVRDASDTEEGELD